MKNPAILQTNHTSTISERSGPADSLDQASRCFRSSGIAARTCGLLVAAAVYAIPARPGIQYNDDEIRYNENGTQTDMNTLLYVLREVRLKIEH